MKLATCLTVAFVLFCSSAFAVGVGDYQDLDQIKLEKDRNITGVPDPQINVGGEDIATAVPIPGLPYTDAGTTCTFVNDYDEICPFSGSLSPDVVYSLSPNADTEINVDLCNSFYDTKVYVYENVAGNTIACNDDACGIDGFRSELLCVPLIAGNTYYIVVDGYGGACGDYDLSVTECVPCIVNCPNGGIPEGEPDCFDGYDDVFNGGCNSTPNVFSVLPCSGGALTVCGRYGGFFHPQSGFDYRDTDWYQLDVPAGGFPNVTFCVEGELPTLMGYIDGNLGCGFPTFVDFLTLNGCQPGCLNLSLPPGPAWFWVGTSGFGQAIGPCGSQYNMTLDGLDCPVSVEPASWAEIKAYYED